jgi:hypothetical protein
LKKELKLEVAHNLISLRLSDPLFFNHVAQSYRGFLSDGKPKVVIETQIVDTIPGTPPKGRRVFFTKRGMRISGNPFRGRVDLAKGKGELYTTAEWLMLSLKVFLRYVYIFLHLHEGDGLALHALGVLKEGEVYVFFGPSGSGKTTAANLSKGHTILSDDLIFLQPEDGSYWVHPTPMWGDMQIGKRENRPYPLKAVFKLVKAEEIGMKKCNLLQALSDVITFPHLPTDLIRPDTLLARFSQLTKGVPFYELYFTKNRSFWPCIDTQLQKIGIKNANK